MEASLCPSSRPKPTTSNSSAIFESLDEGDFAALPLITPKSQQTHHGNLTNSSLKKFSVTKEDLSESALSQGFNWLVKRPPHSEQLFERPYPNEGQNSHSVRHFPHLSKSPQNNMPSALEKQVKSPIVRRVAPLDLPEVGLPANPLSPHSSSQAQASGPEMIPALELFSEHETHGPNSECRQLRSTCGSPTSSRHSECHPLSPPLQHQIAESQVQAPSQDIVPTYSPRVGGDSTVEGKKPHKFVASKDRFENLKLPMKPVQHHYLGQRRSSPKGICGDPEGPPRSTPKLRRHAQQRHHRRESPVLSRPLVASPYHSMGPAIDQSRSQSRASNVSKRRSKIEKRQHRENLEQRELAMHKVAEQWNECLRITREETNEANREIFRLQDEMFLHQQKLDESFQQLSEKDEQIQQAEERCKELEEESSQATTKSQSLGDEVVSLQAQLNESREAVGGLKDKLRAYRSRLNEALEEQQNLFRKSQELCSDTLNEVKKSSAQLVDPDVIHEALETSRKKRAEMKDCFDKIRMDMELSSQKKDQAIAELELKLKLHEEELVRERDLSMKLQEQVEAHSSAQETMTNMASQVEKLLNRCAEQKKEQQKGQEETAQVSTKLDQVIEQLRASSGQVTLGLDAATDQLGQKIVSRILPVVLNMASKQDETEESLSRLNATLHAELTTINSSIGQQKEQRTQSEKSENSRHLEILDLLKNIDDGLREGHKACSGIDNRLAKWIDAEEQARRDNDHSLQDTIIKYRERAFADLESKIQVLSDDYTSKVEAVKTVLLENDGAAKAYLQDVVASIRNTLGEKLDQERSESEQRLRQAAETQAALEEELRNVKKELGDANSSNESQTNEWLQKLELEQKTVLDLKNKLAKSEEEASKFDQLREKWLRDIQAVDAIKNQLRAVSERVPQVEALDARFDNMVKIGQVMTSTSNYLTASHYWVAEQLNPSESSTSTRLPEPEDMSRRRVKIGSPAMEADSPSSPPSVRREQKRRREAATPRSILRFSASSSHESQALDSLSQHNRPVAAKLASVATGHGDHMLQEIRSRLVQTNRGYQFPTVADFERDMMQPIDSQDTAHKKHSLTSAGLSLGPPEKKYKLEDGDSRISKTKQYPRPQERGLKAM